MPSGTGTAHLAVIWHCLARLQLLIQMECCIVEEAALLPRICKQSIQLSAML